MHTLHFFFNICGGLGSENSCDRWIRTFKENCNIFLMKIETYIKRAVKETRDFHSAAGQQDEVYLIQEHKANNKHGTWET